MNKDNKKALNIILKRLRNDGHDDDADAIKIVDMLMHEYGFTRDALAHDAVEFSNELRQLVASWISGEK